MYKVRGNKSTGWFVFYVEEGKPDQQVPKAVSRPEDEARKWEPYQRNAAYRRAHALNERLKPVDKMIAETGAIIL